MICIIDTSIWVAMLNIPYLNDERENILKKFEDLSERNCSFLLPMATIFETGNHIAQNGDGEQRRKVALHFTDLVKQAFEGEAPFTITDFQPKEDILSWLDRFPDSAGQNKTPTKKEGKSFGDLSIIYEYEELCRKLSTREIFIWSLDGDLSAYHNVPKGCVKTTIHLPSCN